MYAFKQFGSKYVLSIDNHQEISAALAAFCREKDIRCGAVYGLGAINKATFRFLDPATKKYVDKTFEEQMEIANLTGNISRSEGKPYLHVHACLGRADYTMIGGHLLRAVVRGACELFIRPMPGPVGRRFDPETGLNLYEF